MEYHNNPLQKWVYHQMNKVGNPLRVSIDHLKYCRNPNDYFTNVGLNYSLYQPTYQWANACQQSNSPPSIGSPEFFDTIGYINPQLCINSNRTTIPSCCYSMNNDIQLPASTNEENKKSLKEVDNVQRKKLKNTENLNAKIIIKLWNVGKVSKIIDKSIHTVYYYTREVKNGEVKVGIDCNSVLKKFPCANLLKVITKQDTKDEEEESQDYEIKKEGNESNMVIVTMKTNGESEKTIILTLRDKKSEKFRIFIKLRDSKTKWRNIDKMEIIDSFIEKFNNVPEKFLNRSIRFGLKEMCETMEIAKKKKIFEEEDIKYMEDAFAEFLDEPEKNTHKKLRDKLFSKVKNDEKIKELKILCLDSLYKFIYNIENDNICMINYYNDKPVYIQFLKEYFVGKSSQNNIIITMNDLKEECKKRNMVLTHKAEEEPQKRKKQKTDTD